MTESEAYPIDAISRSSFRWSVGKYMTKMAVTFGASDLDSNHAMCLVYNSRDVGVGDFAIKTWPTATGIEF